MESKQGRNAFRVHFVSVYFPHGDSSVFWILSWHGSSSPSLYVNLGNHQRSHWKKFILVISCPLEGSKNISFLTRRNKPSITIKVFYEAYERYWQNQLPPYLLPPDYKPTISTCFVNLPSRESTSCSPEQCASPSSHIAAVSTFLLLRQALIVQLPLA